MSTLQTTNLKNPSSATNNIVLDSSGRVGIGVTSPSNTIHVKGSGRIEDSGSSANLRLFYDSVRSSDYLTLDGEGTSGFVSFRTGSSLTERARIDNSGKLGLGTSSPSQLLHLNQSTGDTMIQMYSNTGFVSRLQVTGSDVFAINTGYTERLRILSNGDITFGNGITNAATALSNTVGIGFEVTNGAGFFSRNGAASGFFNRKGSDGDVISIIQDGVQEGTIHVSGTTVTLVGAHLSRWSQILGIDPHDKAVRPEILRGTVMSNLDEMCDWIDPNSGDAQANEQLNKTKISDVEGDKNVAGVFQSWDDDDDTWVNDYYLAMTGDFVIRIAAGVTVERGDLLMSAGDGTAKPQTDDALRSCTIAKVTSTHVSHTFDDGSYCVPCVLMAC